MDEPVAGMNPSAKEFVGSLIQSMSGRGITILLIEHDMKVVMGVSEWLSVINFGKKIAHGLPSDIERDPVGLLDFQRSGITVCFETTWP